MMATETWLEPPFNGLYRRAQSPYLSMLARNPKTGQAERRSTGTADPIAALAEKKRFEAEGPRAPIVAATFTDLERRLIQSYEDTGQRVDRLRYSVAPLRAAFKRYRATAITLSDVKAYIQTRKAAVSPRTGHRLAPATINREVAALKTMLSLLEADSEGRFQSPLSGNAGKSLKLKEAGPRQGFFTRAAFDLVRTQLTDASVQALAEAAYITGWRIASELQTRQWKHVQFTAGWLVLEAGEAKNDAPRQFPLTPELRTVLERQLAMTREVERRTGRLIPWVFHRDGRPVKSFRRQWQTACQRVGIARIPHDLRRTAVRNLNRAGVSRSAAMKMVGHKTESMYTRYSIEDEHTLIQAGGQLSQWLQAESQTGVVPLHSEPHSPPQQAIRSHGGQPNPSLKP